NFRVVPARNQREALHEFQTQPIDQPIDIVLLDLSPREENAWDTVRHLTALQPGLPVVAMTARLEQHHSAASIASLDALMEKPLHLVLLMKPLNHLTSQPPESASRSRNPNQISSSL